MLKSPTLYVFNSSHFFDNHAKLLRSFSFVFSFLKKLLHFAQTYPSHSHVGRISCLPSLLRWKVVKCPLGTSQSPSQRTPIFGLITGHIYYESDLLLLCNHMQCGIVASLFYDVIKRNNNNYNNNNSYNNNLIYLSLPTRFEAHTLCYGPSFFRWFMAHARRERPLNQQEKIPLEIDELQHVH